MVQVWYLECMPSKDVLDRIRRCHICGTVNVAKLSPSQQQAAGDESAQSCSCCGKHLAPFLFFDESVFDGVNAEDYFLSQLPEGGGYRPLWGFLAFWPEEGTQFVRHSKELPRHARRRAGGED